MAGDQQCHRRFRKGGPLGGRGKNHRGDWRRNHGAGNRAHRRIGRISHHLEDLLPTALRRAETEIRANLDKAVELGKVAAPEADAAFQRLEYAGSVEEAAREADLVIEAVPEEMESKIEIFTLLDKICRPSTILASNTSSLSITEIASVTYRAKKCLGMHFFNPVHKMKLLEMVRALETDEDTLATAIEVGKRMGKEVVVIKESPGFITSRINAMIGNEAFYMLQEGIASAADIDKALKLGLNHPMGPFELVDLVGLDTRLNILEYLHKSLGEKFRPAPLLVQYVKAGRLGKKSGHGVYEYPESTTDTRTRSRVASGNAVPAARS